MMTEGVLMSHDWKVGDPHFEYWIPGDLLRQRGTGTEYTLVQVFERTNHIEVTAPHLPPGKWIDSPRGYDNLSEEERVASVSLKEGGSVDSTE